VGHLHSFYEPILPWSMNEVRDIRGPKDLDREKLLDF